MVTQDSLDAREQTLRHWQRLKDIDRETIYLEGANVDRYIAPMPPLVSLCFVVRDNGQYHLLLSLGWDRLDQLQVMWRRK